MNASGRPNTCKSNGAAMLSGARVRNAYVTYLLLGDNFSKEKLIPHNTLRPPGLNVKDLLVKDGHASN